MSSTTVELIFLGTDDAIVTADLGLYLFLFARVYRGALDVETVPEERLAFDDIYYDIAFIRRVRNMMNRHLLKEDPGTLLVNEIQKQSPLKIRPTGMRAALSVAVVLSGGSLSHSGEKAELPPLETGLKLLAGVAESKDAFVNRHHADAPSQGKLDELFEREHLSQRSKNHTAE